MTYAMLAFVQSLMLGLSRADFVRRHHADAMARLERIEAYLIERMCR